MDHTVPIADERRVFDFLLRMFASSSRQTSARGVAFVRLASVHKPPLAMRLRAATIQPNHPAGSTAPALPGPGTSPGKRPRPRAGLRASRGRLAVPSGHAAPGVSRTRAPPSRQFRPHGDANRSRSSRSPSPVSVPEWNRADRHKGTALDGSLATMEVLRRGVGVIPW